MDLNPIPRLKVASVWWRCPQPVTSRRFLLAAVELPDTALARLGRDAKLAEAEQIRAFLRAGGAAIARR